MKEWGFLECLEPLHQRGYDVDMWTSSFDELPYKLMLDLNSNNGCRSSWTCNKRSCGTVYLTFLEAPFVSFLGVTAETDCCYRLLNEQF